MLERLRRQAVRYVGQNDVISQARLFLSGYKDVRNAEPAQIEPVDLNDSDRYLVHQMVHSSKDNADMWDACVLAVEQFTAQQKPLPQVLAAWAVDALKGKSKRPTKRGGAKADRELRYNERDYRIRDAVWCASKELPVYATWDDASSNEQTACHIVSECLVELDKLGDPAGADLGYEAVKKIWLAGQR